MKLIANNQPNFLTESTFENCVMHFNNLLVSHFKMKPLRIYSDLTIQFSLEEKTKKYGSLNIDDIKNFIKNNYKFDQGIKEILSSINNYNDLCRKLELLSCRICEINKHHNRFDVEDKIKNMAKKITTGEVLVLGEYCNWNKTITLYCKNIEKYSIKHNFTVDEGYEETFIHELFHYYNYMNSKVELESRWDYSSDVVKESLASYFEYIYCLTFNIADSSLIKNKWSSYSVFSYPYSGAKEIKDEIKFKNVFNVSLNDIDNAMRILLYFGDFYDIKNQIYVINKDENNIINTNNNVNCNISFYKACQRNSFLAESQNGYLISGSTNKRYSDLSKVKKGDIIFHIFNGNLYAISVAKTNANIINDNGTDKWYVSSDYIVFQKPINISKFKNLPCYIKYNPAIEPYFKLFDNKDFIKVLLNEIKALIPTNLFNLILNNL